MTVMMSQELTKLVQNTNTVLGCEPVHPVSDLEMVRFLIIKKNCVNINFV